MLRIWAAHSLVHRALKIAVEAAHQLVSANLESGLRVTALVLEAWLMVSALLLEATLTLMAMEIPFVVCHRILAALAHTQRLSWLRRPRQRTSASSVVLRPITALCG